MKSNRFAFTTLIVFFLFLGHSVIGQTDTAMGYRLVPGDHESRIIADQKNHIEYILDKSRTCVEAIAQNGNRLWKTDPWMDYEWKVAPTERPKVVTFILINDSSTHFRDVLAVHYDNLGFASIDPKTGKIIKIGQD